MKPFRHQPEHLPAGVLRTLEDIVAETSELAQRFVDLGHRVFLVGGIVRDLLSERNLSGDIDLDLTTDATPDQIKEIVGPLAEAVWLQGERFGTIGARVRERAYEITTHRSEVYVPDSRKPTVEFSRAIDDDLSRRDFTVNAMAIELSTKELIDPFGGRSDLLALILRTPLDPEVSFTDDPLRMLRAARFRAGSALEPTPELLIAMTALAERVEIVSSERVRDELDKLLSVSSPTLGLTMLADTGVLGRVLPEVDQALLDRRGPGVDRLASDPTLRLSALLFGLDPDVIRGRLGELRHSNQRRAATLTIIASAVALGAGGVVDAASMRRWVGRAGAHRADAREVVSAVVPGGEALAVACQDLEDELGAELDDLSPALSGEEVMALLGVPEGPDVGEAMRFLQDLRYDEGPIDPSEARRRLLAHRRQS